MGSLPFLLTISAFSSLLISLVNSAPKTDPVRVAYSIKESKSSFSSKGPTVRLAMPLAESTLPHAPVLREMNESDQHDMSTSTPSSESLESQLQSPHIVRKKALADDFDTSGQTDDLLLQLAK